MKKRELLASKNRSEWQFLIREWVHNIDDRHMLELFLLDGYSVEEISDKMNLTARWTQKRIARAKKQLFDHIK